MLQVKNYIKAISVQTLVYTGIFLVTVAAVAGFFVWSLLFQMRVIAPLRYSSEESSAPSSSLNFADFDPVARKLHLPWPPKE